MRSACLQGIPSFGRLDGLVNNAGVWETGSAGGEDEAHIRRHMNVNVYGTYFIAYGDAGFPAGCR